MGKTKVTPQTRNRIAEMRNKLERIAIPGDFAAVAIIKKNTAVPGWSCLACGTIFNFSFHNESVWLGPNFCPNCGRPRAAETQEKSDDSEGTR